MIFAVYLLTLSNLNKTFEYFANNIRITIYMKVDISNEKIITFKEALSNLDEVKTIHQYSQTQALEQFKNIFQNKDFDFSVFKKERKSRKVLQESRKPA